MWKHRKTPNAQEEEIPDKSWCSLIVPTIALWKELQSTNTSCEMSRDAVISRMKTTRGGVGPEGNHGPLEV